MKKFTLLSLIAFFVCSTAWAAMAGDGTAANPYVVTLADVDADGFISFKGQSTGGSGVDVFFKYVATADNTQLFLESCGGAFGAPDVNGSFDISDINHGYPYGPGSKQAENCSMGMGMRFKQLLQNNQTYYFCINTWDMNLTYVNFSANVIVPCVSIQAVIGTPVTIPALTTTPPVAERFVTFTNNATVGVAEVVFTGDMTGAELFLVKECGSWVDSKPLTLVNNKVKIDVAADEIYYFAIASYTGSPTATISVREKAQGEDCAWPLATTVTSNLNVTKDEITVKEAGETWYQFTAPLAGYTDFSFSALNAQGQPAVVSLKIQRGCELGVVAQEYTTDEKGEIKAKLPIAIGETINFAYIAAAGDRLTVSFSSRAAIVGEDAANAIPYTSGVKVPKAPGKYWYSFTPSRQGILYAANCGNADFATGNVLVYTGPDASWGNIVTTCPDKGVATKFEIASLLPHYIVWEVLTAAKADFTFTAEMQDFTPGTKCVNPKPLLAGGAVHKDPYTDMYYNYVATQTGEAAFSFNSKDATYAEIVKECGEFYPSTVPPLENGRYALVSGQTYNLKIHVNSLPAELVDNIFSVSFAAGIDDATESSLSVFPNPTHGDFTVSGFGERAQLNIYSAMGESVYSSWVLGDSANIQLQGVAAGIYFVKIVSEGRESVQKLIVR